MRILVPSYGRAGFASTMSLLPSAEIVVPASQYQEYKKWHNDRVIYIDDSKDGNIAKKRNAILDLVDDGELFWMLDDDLLKAEAIKHNEVNDIEQLLEAHYDLMQSAGASFGGFSIYQDPVKYAEYAPFSFTKPSYGAVCIRKMTGVSYDTELGRFEDVDYFLKTIHRGGSVLRDNRFYFTFQCNKDKKSNQVGGIDGSELKYGESLNKLIKRWGSIIKVTDGKMMGINQPLIGV